MMAPTSHQVARAARSPRIVDGSRTACERFWPDIVQYQFSLSVPITLILWEMEGTQGEESCCSFCWVGADADVDDTRSDDSTIIP